MRITITPSQVERLKAAGLTMGDGNIAEWMVRRAEWDGHAFAFEVMTALGMTDDHGPPRDVLMLNQVRWLRMLWVRLRRAANADHADATPMDCCRISEEWRVINGDDS